MGEKDIKEIYSESQCPKCKYQFSSPLVIDSVNQKEIPITCPRCKYRYYFDVEENSMKQYNISKIRKSQEKLTFRYIDQIPVEIGNTKVICSFCNQEYEAIILIDSVKQKECESICTNCNKKNLIPVNKQVLNRYLRKAHISCIEEEKENRKKEEGWNNSFYPGYIWETYERDFLPHQKYPHEQLEILEKYDKDRRLETDYNQLLIAFYDHGNLEDSIALHYRDGGPYLLNNEEILNKVANVRCIIKHYQESWSGLDHAIKTWKEIFTMKWQDLLDDQFGLFAPPIGKGNLYFTNLRIIYLHDIRKGYMAIPSLSDNYLTSNKYQASVIRYYIGRKDGFSIPKRYILAHNVKNNLIEVYFEIENEDKHMLSIYAKEGLSDITQHL